MSTDNSTFLRQTGTEIVRGLMKERKPNPIDRLFTPKIRRSIHGREPIRATVDTLARDLEAKAPGADPQFLTGAMTYIDYDMLSYKLGIEMTDEEIEDLKQYGTDPLKEWFETVLDNVDIGMELDGKAKLTDTNLNNSDTVGTAWSDPTAKISEDIQDGILTYCPKPTCALVGYGTAFDILRHPETKVMTANYSSQASLSINDDFREVRAFVSMTTGINPAKVVVADSFYNSAAEGQAETLAYTFNKFFWVGHSDATLLLEQPNSKRVTTAGDHGNNELVFRRTLALIRAIKAKGLNYASV